MPEKILIVDDDIDSLKLIGLMLQRQGYSIVPAQSGAQALTLAESEQPVLMLLDVMMPDMDGYEVCRRVRRNPQLAHIPIMMFTAKTLVDDKVAGFEAGADDYLTKPTHPAELASRIKLVLERSRRQHAAPATRRGRVYALLAARNGIGATTVGINLGISLIQLEHPAILAELRPGFGSAGLQLGFNRSTALAALRSKPVGEIGRLRPRPTSRPESSTWPRGACSWAACTSRSWSTSDRCPSWRSFAPRSRGCTWPGPACTRAGALSPARG